MADTNRALVGRILVASAVVLTVLAVLCWTGVLPVDPRARGVLGAALGAAALADATIGIIFVTRSRQS